MHQNIRKKINRETSLYDKVDMYYNLCTLNATNINNLTENIYEKYETKKTPYDTKKIYH